MARLGPIGELPGDARQEVEEPGSLRQMPKVVLCADTSGSVAQIAPHAKALATALGMELVVVHVMEPHSTQHQPVDPVVWDIQRREAEVFVTALLKEYALDGSSTSIKVLQGHASEQISSCLDNDCDDIAVLCRSDLSVPGRIGHTARQVLEAGRSSLLMVPAGCAHMGQAHYRRVLVPLDGSSRGEAAISIAAKIAHAEHGEIILVTAVPQPFLIQAEPMTSEDIELSDRLQRRNELAAREYLQRQSERLRSCGAAVRTVLLSNGDIRRQLKKSIDTELADLVVLASHGEGGHADVATGDTAIFLLGNSTVPVLLIRQANSNGNSRVYSATQLSGIRRPNGAV